MELSKNEYLRVYLKFRGKSTIDTFLSMIDGKVRKMGKIRRTRDRGKLNNEK